jgi:hypothetical protein
MPYRLLPIVINPRLYRNSSAAAFLNAPEIPASKAIGGLLQHFDSSMITAHLLDWALSQTDRLCPIQAHPRAIRFWFRHEPF